MLIKVKYFGHLGFMLKKRDENIEVAARSTVLELLNQLACIYTGDCTEEVYDPCSGRVKEGFAVIVNGIAANQLNGVETKLKNNDVVLLIPIFAGGGLYSRI